MSPEKMHRQEAMQNKHRQAVLYARVSSKEQEKEGFSIDAQLKLLRGYAKYHEFDVVQEFLDVETAKQAGRTKFGEMVAFLRKNRSICIVLVEKTDRLYRNIRDWVTLDELDPEIHFVKENTVISKQSRSSEKFMHGIKVLMAKNYIDNLSEETRKGMLEKAEQGIWPSFAPMGYRNVTGPSGKKIIEPNPDEAPIIRRYFEWYATGQYSLKDMVKMARAEGAVPRRKKTPFYRSVLHKILRNKIYAGWFEWDGKNYKGNHVPLVSRELWERVQQIIENRNLTKHKIMKHDFAFSRLIRCGHCGCSLIGEIKKERFVYYHCTGYKGKCPEPYVRQEVVEREFTKLLNKLVFDEEVIGWISQALRESHADEKQHHEEAISRLQYQYNKLQKRIDVMYVDKLDGGISAEFFNQKSTEWRTEQERILGDIEAHQNVNQTYFEDSIRLLELAQRAPALFEKQQASEKRRLLNFLLSNCTWKDGKLSAEFRQPFDILAVAAESHQSKKAAGATSDDLFANWLPGQDSNLRHGG